MEVNKLLIMVQDDTLFQIFDNLVEVDKLLPSDDCKAAIESVENEVLRRYPAIPGRT